MVVGSRMGPGMRLPRSRCDREIDIFHVLLVFMLEGEGQGKEEVRYWDMDNMV